MRPSLSFLLPILLLVLVSIGLLFWYLQNSKLVPKKGGVLIEGMVGQPHLINPLYADLNPIDREIASLIFRGLVKYDEQNEPVADLAESWTISEDGKTYTVVLKNDQFWQDHQPITADDVVFTYKLTQDEKYDGPEKTTFKQVQIEKVDQKTIRFSLSEPFAPFLEALSLGILPRHLLASTPIRELPKNPFNLEPVGSGRAKVVKLKLGADRKIHSLILSLSGGFLQTLVFSFYDSEESLLSAFLLGEIDAFATTNHELVEKAKPTVPSKTATLFGSQYLLFFNLETETVKNIKLRQLLLLATPQGEFGEEADGFFPKQSWVYDPEAKQPAFDLEKAKTKLAEAEIVNLSLTITVPKRKMLWELASQIQAVWESLGLKINLNEVETNEIEEKIIKPRNFEVLLFGQELGRDPDPYVFWHSTQSKPPGLNLSGLSHRRVDKALEDGRKKLSLEERKRAYQSLQKALALETPAITLYRPGLFYITSPKIKGVSLDNLWVSADRFRDINQWFILQKRVRI